MTLFSALTACVALLALGCKSAGRGDAAPRRYDIATLLGSLRLGSASISPDGSKVLFSSNQSGVINAWVVPFGGGAAMPLTSSTTDSIAPLSWFPADERVLYASDQGGNELDHVFVRERDGSVRDLTPGDKHKAVFADFAHDERSFFVATNERDPKYFDVYEYAVDGYARTEFFRNDAGAFPGVVSRDKRYLALGKPSTTNDSDVLLFDRTTGATKNLTEHRDAEQNDAVAFTPDGGLLIATNRGSEFTQLVRIDLASGERRVVHATDWDVVGAFYSPDDRYLLVATNVAARTELALFDSRTMARVPLPAVPSGDVTGVSFAKKGDKLAFFVASSRSPSSLWSADLATGKARELVSALHPDIDEEDLVEGRVVGLEAADGMMIPGILYVPHGATFEQRVPAVVWVHGGPGGQSRLTYSPLLQYLVNHGFAVYAVNNRGSSGYGKTFFAADDRKHGEADLDDVVASKMALAMTGVVDPSRIGIMGGSYGGYMTLAALAYRPNEFAVGVDIFGVANWVRTLESIPPWWEAQRQALYAELGDPATDGERLRRISPLFHAKNITKPLLVLQGKNDPRVLEVESAEIVAAVKQNGVPVEYVLFPDEGHGFEKLDNEKVGYEAVLRFLKQHLGTPHWGRG